MPIATTVPFAAERSMMRCTTAKQVAIRQALSINQQLAFDVEFSRKRLSKLWFGLLWGFLGFFFGHTIYYFLKVRDLPKEDSGARTWLWAGPTMLWVGTLFFGPGGPVLAIIGTTINGLYYLFSADFERVNDKIAENIASKVKCLGS